MKAFLGEIEGRMLGQLRRIVVKIFVKQTIALSSGIQIKPVSPTFLKKI